MNIRAHLTEIHRVTGSLNSWDVKTRITGSGHVWTLGPTVSKLTVASEKRQAWCTSGAVIDVDDDDDTNDDR